MANTDTFISYRRQFSMHLARNIFVELNRRGINAFLDVESIDSTQFDTFILKQIEARPNFVLVLSPGSFARCAEPGDWLLREIQHAVQHKRNIVPVWDAGFRGEEFRVLPPELHSLEMRNAVNFSMEYYAGFIDRIIDFIQHSQDDHKIVVQPASPADTVRANQAIRKALADNYQDDRGSVVELLGEYHKRKLKAKTTADYETLLQFWSRIHASGGIPSYFQFDTEERQLRELLEKQLKIDSEKNRLIQREADYDLIRQMTRNPDIPRKYVQTQLEAFWSQYPEEPKYDPDDLSGERERARKQAEEQQRREAAIAAARAARTKRDILWEWALKLRLGNAFMWLRPTAKWYDHKPSALDLFLETLSLGLMAVIFAIGLLLKTVPWEWPEYDELRNIIVTGVRWSPSILLVMFLLYLLVPPLASRLRFPKREAEAEAADVFHAIPLAIWSFLITTFLIYLGSSNPVPVSIAVLVAVIGVVVGNGIRMSAYYSKHTYGFQYSPFPESPRRAYADWFTLITWVTAVVIGLAADGRGLLIAVVSLASCLLFAARAKVTLGFYPNSSNPNIKFSTIVLVGILIVVLWITFFGGYHLLLPA